MGASLLRRSSSIARTKGTSWRRLAPATPSAEKQRLSTTSPSRADALTTLRANHVAATNYILDSADRDAFAEQLTQRGVGSGVYYPTPIHRLPSFRLDLDLPVTEVATTQVLSLPIYPSLTEDELGTIVEAVNAVAKAGA